MARWAKEHVEQICRDNGWLQSMREIEHGVQFELTDGTPIAWYKTGKVVVRGKQTDLKAQAERVFSGEPPVSQTIDQTTVSNTFRAVSPRRVFIVYGHDADAREQLELILRRLSLEPIVLQNVPSTGDTIIEKLEALTAADFACVLLTPDDEGHPAGVSKEKRPRARQNVVLELGMVLAKLGRRRVAILTKGKKLERPSDIEGLIYLPFQQRVDEVKNHLAANLQEAGFEIQVKDLLS
jgi:predicted nucleotide-binding protein